MRTGKLRESLTAEICISDGDKIRRAKALEICPDGRLKVEEADGSLSVLSYGEVSIII